MQIVCAGRIAFGVQHHEIRKIARPKIPALRDPVHVRGRAGGAADELPQRDDLPVDDIGSIQPREGRILPRVPVRSVRRRHDPGLLHDQVDVAFRHVEAGPA